MIKKSISLVANLFVPYITISLASRIILTIYSLYSDQIFLNTSFIIKLFCMGVFNDLVAYLYLIAPITIISLFITNKFKHSLIGKIIFYIFIYSWIFILCFNLVAEYIFWDEFSSRFNFIAVDYLIYTKEVFGNIFESYPLVKIIFAIIITSFIIFSFHYKKYDRFLASNISFKQNLFQILFINGLMLICFVFYQEVRISNNRYEFELSKNGIYSLFSAFRNNSLSYEQYYDSLPAQQAESNLKLLLDLENMKDFSKAVHYPGKPNDYNIILVAVESLSAEFMHEFGDNNNLMPHLNKYAEQSLLFTNYFATGTRTVRGLEAMSLSLPPTPGNSIVRRPNNSNLFSIASVLKSHDYNHKFIYGGYGYFDNMNSFFTNNNFKIIDRAKITKKDISFSNVWGVCDEDLFKQVIKEADDSYSKDEKFFSFVLTTSNHRPYTYPANKINIPSGTNRAGAVKYTDYAINKFLESAKTKPWFAKTIFVITADHCASSAGKTEIPIEKYHIPLIIYAPHIIKPQFVDKLASQIDLAPTLLGLLNISYQSKFFGSDIMHANFPERAFLGTYQQLALYKNRQLVVLSPQLHHDFFKVENNFHLKSSITNNELLEEAITYYQMADHLFHTGKYISY